MSHSKFRTCTALCLSACLLLGTAATTAYAKETDDASQTPAGQAEYTKIENVYAKLKTDGSRSGAYIVNHFQVDKAGTITDHGAYSKIINQSTADPLTDKDGTVSFSADEGNFYYQGNMKDAELPWNFQISYQLNGDDITPEQLGGEDGALKITFHGEKNPKADAVFYENYVMQVSLTLDSDICSNIKAPNATIADAGDGTQISFTVLPGDDADFTIETDVKDFSMPGFSIAAVPYSANIDTEDFNMDDFTDQIDELTDAVGQLNTGAKSLADGIRQLDDGSTSIVDGSKQIRNGLSLLNKNSGSITNASSEIASALATISNRLNSADFSGLSKLKQLPSGLEQLADSLDQMQSGLEQLKDGFGQSYETLNGAFAQAQASQPTQEELQALQAACAEDEQALSGYQKLMESYQQLQKLTAIWNKVSPAFQSVDSALDASGEHSVCGGLSSVSKGLHTMADSMSDSLSGTDVEKMMAQLASGLSSLSNSYGDFDDGLSSYVSGVRTLAQNYKTFHKGLVQYSNGTSSLADGADEFADGMDEFSDGICTMPTQIQDTIDEMMEKYNSSDFDAVSFTSSENTNINSVQFVISTDSIECPEAKPAETEEKQLSFWDRLIALFHGKG